MGAVAEIRIELSGALAELEASDAGREIEDSVSRAAGDLAALAGQAARPVVRVVGSSANRAVTVRVGDEVLRYPPSLLVAAWQSVVRAELRWLPCATQEPPGFPDRWLLRLAEERGMVRPLVGCLGTLASAVLAGRPSSLLDPRNEVEAATAWLLDRGVREWRAEDLELPFERGFEAARENLFARLRRPAARVHTVLSLFEGVDPAGDLEMLAHHMAVTTGAFARIELVHDPAVPAGCVHVAVNDRARPAVACLDPGEDYVAATTEELEALDVPSHPVFAPDGVRLGSAVDRRHSATLADAGYGVRDCVDYAIAIVGHRLRLDAPDLLDVVDVEHNLARVSVAAPALARDLTALLPAWAIAELLRRLSAEGVPVRQLPTLFQHFAEGAVTARDGDRLESILAATRRAMRDQICTAAAPGGLLRLLAVEPDDAGLLDSVWVQVGPLLRAGLDVALVAPVGRRQDVRDALAAELPTLPVLAEDEVAPQSVTATAWLGAGADAAPVAGVAARL